MNILIHITIYKHKYKQTFFKKYSSISSSVFNSLPKCILAEAFRIHWIFRVSLFFGGCMQQVYGVSEGTESVQWVEPALLDPETFLFAVNGVNVGRWDAVGGEGNVLVAEEKNWRTCQNRVHRPKKPERVSEQEKDGMIIFLFFLSHFFFYKNFSFIKDMFVMV